MPFDVMVIGSGFGGAVAALRFAEAGAKVLVLERGRRWTAETLPREPGDPWLWSHSNPERHNGWLDLRLFPHMAVAQGAAVGGGSHIYANISTPAPASAFADGWPAEITYADLAPHYATVADMMEVAPVPANQWTERMKLMRDAATAIGAADRFRQVDLAVKFDPDWTYARPREESASKPVVNKHGAAQGTACISANAMSVVPSRHATRSISTISIAPRRSLASRCARCTSRTASRRRERVGGSISSGSKAANAFPASKPLTSSLSLPARSARPSFCCATATSTQRSLDLVRAWDAAGAAMEIS